MNRGAKITLVVFVILFVMAGLVLGAWFIFKQDRASAAESYLKRGDEYLNDGDYALALIAYKKAALLTPHSYAPYFKQGELAKETGHYAEAINYFNRSLDFGPAETSIYFALGDTHLLNNNLSGAKTSFEQAKKLIPESDEIDFLLFKTALKGTDVSGAQKNLAAAEKNNPLPRYKIYDALLESFSDPTKSLDKISQISQCADIGGLSLADFSNLFQKLASTENITSREVMIYHTFSQIGEVDFGVAGLEKIGKDNPEMRDVWIFLSYGYLLKNQPDKAKTALDKALELDPVFPATYYLLSKYYELKQDTIAAKDAYEQAKELGFDENSPLKS